MAYRDDIAALGANHLYIFEGNAADDIGSLTGTSSSMVVDTAIAEDATNSLSTNAITDRVTLPTSTDVNNSAQSRKAVCGWFMVTAVQNPPKSIYGEGDATQAFRFILGWGNRVMFEVDDPNFTLQIFGDVALAVDRPYHLTMIFEGNGFGNEFRAYIDGIKQLNAEPTNRQPDAATLTARTVGEFADPAGTVGVGGVAVILLAPINGKWNHWATFDGADAVLTDAEIRETLFEKGALADDVLSSGTEAVMQTAIDAFADTVRPNYPVCIRVPANTGDTDFTLELDNVTFDPLASVHIQYMGTQTLTIINTNGSDAAIVSTPNGGTVVVKERTNITFTVLDFFTLAPVADARVYLEADGGGDLASGTQILNTTTNASGIASVSFDIANDQPVLGRVRKASAAPFYKTANILETVTSDGINQTVLILPDQ